MEPLNVVLQTALPCVARNDVVPLFKMSEIWKNILVWLHMLQI